MTKRKPRPNSTQIVIKKASLNLHWSDGAGFSRPSQYRGYYITYAEFDPKTSELGLNIMQRILPEITEHTDENDKLAVNVLDDFAHSIENTFDKHLVQRGGKK